MKILVTGAAGFIGYHLCKKLLEEKFEVYGIDNMNGYYDTLLKEERVRILQSYPLFTFEKLDISDKENLDCYFERHNFTTVINLAAQAGVRYSLKNPDTYITSNIIGFYNVLECSRKYEVKHLVFASSSSVYGGNTKVPYCTEDKTDTPVSLYAATKKCDELIAYSYSKIYQLRTTGLRFFTVYGPYGRPDMAYFKFTNKLVNNEKIKVYNFGNCERDFTYIDDIVNSIFKIIIVGETDKSPLSNLDVPYKIYNLGHGHPVNLLKFIDLLLEKLVKYGIIDADKVNSDYKELVPMQKGDVPVTYADTSDLQKDYGYKLEVSLDDGLDQFAKWYSEFYSK